MQKIEIEFKNQTLKIYLVVKEKNLDKTLLNTNIISNEKLLFSLDYIAKNQKLVSGFLKGNRKLDSEAFKQAQKEMMAIREQTFEDINFGKGITSSSLITQKVKADFKTALKTGLAKGERNVTNYKRTFPLMIKGNADSCYDQGKRKPLDFYYDNDDIYIRWCNGIIFKVVLGTRINENTTELKHTLHKIIKGEYRVSQSSLQFDKNNNLIMNVNIRFKKELNTDFVEG